MIRLTVRDALAATALVVFPSCAQQQLDTPTRADAAVPDTATQTDTAADSPPDAVDDQPTTDDVAQPDAPKPDVPTVIDAPPTDVGGCMTGLTECGGSCRDTQTDPMHCGGCGQLCVGGQTCTGGRCACPTGRTLCGATCVDTGADPNHCGACGTRCPMGQACSTGACMLTCAAGTMLCAGACRDVMSDPAHCGMCGRACSAGGTCASGVCRAGVPRGPEFRVNWLGSTTCRGTEHASVTGSDRGGIAITNAQLFYTGQTATGRFHLGTLEGVATSGRYDTLVSNLRTAVVYVFVDAMGTPLSAPGGTAVALREIDSTTGVLTTRQVMLSAPISMMATATASSIGLFSGWDRLLVISGGHAYNIDLPSGAVIDLGVSDPPPHAPCNAWAFWGVAEFSSGIPSVVYVANTTTIARRPLPSGPVTQVSQFTNLSNMCGFTLAPAAQRWYFHHARASQLAGSTGSVETVGYCEASTSVAGAACAPGISSCGGICRNLMTDAMNCGACGNVCGATQSCMGGACTAAPTRYTRTLPPDTAPFIDACTTPGHATVLSNADDGTIMVMMPFDFRFWGMPVASGTMFTVVTNGYMFFGPGSAPLPLMGTIPSSTTPNGVIAPQWRDLQTATDGICIASAGTAPDRRFVVHWSNVRNYLGSGTNQLNFEAVLNERDASIDFLYTTMNGAQSATAGIENQAGTAVMGACPSGATVTQCVIPANTRVRFVPAP